MADEVVTSVGEARQHEHEMIDLMMEFAHSLADAGEFWLEHMSENDPDIQTQRAFGEMIWSRFETFQNEAINQMESSGALSAEQAAAQRTALTEAASRLSEAGEAADARLAAMGEVFHDLAKNAETAGGVVAGMEVLEGFAKSLADGDPKGLADALGKFAAGGIGAELGGIVAGLLAGVFGLTGGWILLAAFAGAVLVGKAFAGLFGEFLGYGWQNYLAKIHELFTGSQAWFPRRDPLTLDLDGDGIESVGINTTNPILFDHDGDGVKNATGWISPDDGFLVLDRNGNGTIDSGRELFGDSTPVPGGTAEDGFAALAAEDTNHDGRVDASDAHFADLRVWRDLNQDGISQSNELFTLTQLGISAINVGGVNRNQVLGNGNQIADVGTFVRSDGTQGALGETRGTADVDLAENTFYRDFPDDIPLVEGVEDLPNAPGAGNVRDLWQAASMSENLRTLLGNYSHLTTREEQFQAIDALMRAWAGTAGMKSMEQRADDIGYAFGWWKLGNLTYPGSGGATWTVGGGDGDTMAMPADFPDPSVWEQTRANWDAEVTRVQQMFGVLEAFNGSYFFAMPEQDTTKGARWGIAVYQPDPNGGGGARPMNWGGPSLVVGLDQAQLDALNASYQMLRQTIYDALVLQTRLAPINDMILLHIGANGIRLDFTNVEAEFASRISQDSSSGMADLLDYARAQQRRMVGNDWHGWDLVANYVQTLSPTPELTALYTEFGVHVTPGGTSPFIGDAKNNVLIGSADADTISGGEGSDALVAGGGNDHLNGDGGADFLEGQQGDDQLYGGEGDDVLEGNAGNDYLQGGQGNDIYVFRRGDGQDTIDNTNWYSAAFHDTLKFGDGIRASDLRLSSDGFTVTFELLHSNDRVTGIGFIGTETYSIGDIQFTQAATWDLTTLRDMIKFGTPGDDVLFGNNIAAALYGGEGNDQLTGGDGNDTIDGGGGNDVLIGGAGEDVLTDIYGSNELRGGDGDDTITGAGIIEGGKGNDTLTGWGNGDTYVYNLGDGADTISDYGYQWLTDTLQLGSGLTPSDLSLARTGDDMVFRFNANDQITIKGWFSNNSMTTLEQLTFADGTTLSLTDLQGMTPAPYFGTANGEYIPGWDGIDVIDAGAGGDTINGYGGNDQLAGGDGNDTINGGTGDDAISGGAGNDTLDGGDGNDVIDGGDGDDTITDLYATNVVHGGAGNDIINAAGTIEGGAGNDIISGTGAENTYLFNVGDGADTIYEWGWPWIVDTMQFGAGINPGDVTLARNGDDIIFRIGGNDQVTVKGWYSNNWNTSIEQFTFANGTTWNLADVQALTPTAYVSGDAADSLYGWDGIDILNGGGGDDWIRGFGGNDQLAGGDGNDSLHGDEGADSLSGGAGDDSLEGDNGDDVLDGGAGNDTIYDVWGTNVARGGAGDDSINASGSLEGGTGNDVLSGTGAENTYVFNRGDGADTIYDRGYSWIIDTLKFGAGISASNVAMARSGDDMVFMINANDRITVKNWYTDSMVGIERFEFADGTALDLAAFQQQAPVGYIGTDAGETINGWDGIDIIDGAGGNDWIRGYGGNDQISGGAGNDSLYGDNGNDTLSGGAGNDSIEGGGDNDTMDGGDGDDTIYDLWGSNVARGGAGNDSINVNGTAEGGTGNDVISGTGSENTYIFNVGDGSDTIYEWGYPWIVDAIQFGAGITASNLTLARSGDDIMFRINGTDQITVKGWYSNNWYTSIEQFRFADGTTWGLGDIQALTPAAYVAGDAADSLYGWDGIDVMDGAGGNDWIRGYGNNDQLSGGDGNDSLYGDNGNDTLLGGAGNDYLQGDNDNDTMDGGAGDDTIYDLWGANVSRGGAGNDSINASGTIEGGAGNDVISGTGSENTYVFNIGDGQDTVYEWGYPWIVDAIQFGTGILTSDLTLARNGDDIIFRINGADQVTVKGWYSNNWYTSIEQFRFADGTTWGLGDIQARTPTAYVSGDAADSLYGWDGIDILDGAGGNDWIRGYGNNDQLSGGDGNDSLYGDNGNDTLLGGAGNDYLQGDNDNDTMDGGAGDDTIYDLWGANVSRGGAGNDNINASGTIEGGAGNDVISGTGAENTYVFNVGDGQDTIYEWGYPWVVDAIQFGAGISTSNLALARNGDDIIFRINGDDQITVKGWYSNNWNTSIEQLRFADGTVWGLADLQARTPVAYVSGDGADSLYGWDGIDVVDGAGGNDWIRGYGNNDQLSGGDGNDNLYGDNGNDTLLGGAGNDYLEGNNDDDTLEGGDGDDTISDVYGVNIARGGAGNDSINVSGTIEGGAGNDVLSGTAGENTYLFNTGDGADTIYEGGYWWVVDTLRFGEGVSSSDVIGQRVGNDLVFHLNQNDRVTVANWFSDTSWFGLEQIQFADGTTWSGSTLAAFAASASTDPPDWNGPALKMNRESDASALSADMYASALQSFATASAPAVAPDSSRSLGPHGVELWGFMAAKLEFIASSAGMDTLGDEPVAIAGPMSVTGNRDAANDSFGVILGDSKAALRRAWGAEHVQN